MKYTKEEIESNINILENDKLGLLRRRKSLNIEFKQNRDQIKKWRELDESQTKLF